MAMNWRRGGVLVGGLLLGVLGAAALFSGNGNDDREQRASQDAPPRTLAVAGAPAVRCSFEPIVPASSREDGMLPLDEDLQSGSSGAISALLVSGKEAAAAGKPKDAETAFLMACRSAEMLKSDPIPLADAHYHLARHYAQLAANPAAPKRDELIKRAQALYVSSLSAYRAHRGPDHEKTRFAQQGLERLQQVAGGSLPALAAAPAAEDTRVAGNAPQPPATAAAPAPVAPAAPAGPTAAPAPPPAAVAAEPDRQAQLAEGQRRQQEAQLAEEQRREREAKVAEQQRREGEAKAIEEQRRQREAQLAEQQRREREAKAAEEQRQREVQLAEQQRREREAKAAEEQRRQREAQLAEQQRREREAKAAEEQRRQREAQAAAAAPAAPPPQPERQARRTNPSFDCKLARSVTERLICADEDLARQDRELGRIHAQAKRNAPDQRAFQRQSDAEWSRREATCKDRECLQRWYAQRRQDLAAAAAAPQPAPAERSEPAAARERDPTTEVVRDPVVRRARVAPPVAVVEPSTSASGGPPAPSPNESIGTASGDVGAVE